MTHPEDAPRANETEVSIRPLEFDLVDYADTILGARLVASSNDLERITRTHWDSQDGMTRYDLVRYEMYEKPDKNAPLREYQLTLTDNVTSQPIRFLRHNTAMNGAFACDKNWKTLPGKQKRPTEQYDDMREILQSAGFDPNKHLYAPTVVKGLLRAREADFAGNAYKFKRRRIRRYLQTYFGLFGGLDTSSKD